MMMMMMLTMTGDGNGDDDDNDDSDDDDNNDDDDYGHDNNTDQKAVLRIPLNKLNITALEKWKKQVLFKLRYLRK